MRRRRPVSMMNRLYSNPADLTVFDCVIDARTPAEFAEDHLPGAINLPVLDNEQRVTVGTLYKQVGAFEARRLGGALVAENIARHLRTALADKPRNWRPLIYCWRGGQRSGAFTEWLRQVGWSAMQLEGGYKRWRAHVREQLDRLPGSLTFRVISGPTGSAKTRVLESLAGMGEQVLDLEALAAHRGSVLGALPDRPQPTQKAFERALLLALAAFDPARPVFVEAESRKIGMLHVPEALILRMRAAPCLIIDASRDARIRFLLQDYAFLGDDREALRAKLGRLRGLQSGETLARWDRWAAEGAQAELFAELIDRHYDPLYHRSQHHNYMGMANARHLVSETLDADGIRRLAEQARQQPEG